MLIYQIIVTLLCFQLIAVGLINLAQVARDRRDRRIPAGDENWPSVTVCVPARNEADNIAGCIRSLAAQDYPDFEALVLDDGSEDGTGEIARRAAEGAAHVRVIEGRPLEPGWIGKSFACHQLSGAARGQWLLFTDADTVFAPHALREAVTLAQRRGADLLSAPPRLLALGVWEQLSVPLLTSAGAGLFAWRVINRPRPAFHAAASGAFILISREAYESIGGHGAVRGRIVEDIELARAVKRRGLRLYLTDGSDWVVCRMYRNLREVWEGFTKNTYAAFGLLTPVALAMLVMIFTAPAVIFVIGPGLGISPASATWLPLAQMFFAFGWRAIGDRRFGSPSFRSLLMTPLAPLFWGAIGMASFWRGLRGVHTPWRGRHYDLGK